MMIRTMLVAAIVASISILDSLTAAQSVADTTYCTIAGSGGCEACVLANAGTGLLLYLDIGLAGFDVMQLYIPLCVVSTSDSWCIWCNSHKTGAVKCLAVPKEEFNPDSCQYFNYNIATCSSKSIHTYIYI